MANNQLNDSAVEDLLHFNISAKENQVYTTFDGKSGKEKYKHLNIEQILEKQVIGNLQEVQTYLFNNNIEYQNTDTSLVNFPLFNEDYASFMPIPLENQWYFRIGDDNNSKNKYDFSVANIQLAKYNLLTGEKTYHKISCQVFRSMEQSGCIRIVESVEIEGMKLVLVLHDLHQHPLQLIYLVNKLSGLGYNVMVPYMGDIIENYKYSEDMQHFTLRAAQIISQLTEDYMENVTLLSHGMTAEVSLLLKNDAKYKKLVMCNPIGDVSIKNIEIETSASSDHGEKIEQQEGHDTVTTTSPHLTEEANTSNTFYTVQKPNLFQRTKLKNTHAATSFDTYFVDMEHTALKRTRFESEISRIDTINRTKEIAIDALDEIELEKELENHSDDGYREHIVSEINDGEQFECVSKNPMKYDYQLTKFDQDSIKNQLLDKGYHNHSIRRSAKSSINVIVDPRPQDEDVRPHSYLQDNETNKLDQVLINEDQQTQLSILLNDCLSIIYQNPEIIQIMCTCLQLSSLTKKCQVTNLQQFLGIGQKLFHKHTLQVYLQSLIYLNCFADLKYFLSFLQLENNIYDKKFFKQFGFFAETLEGNYAVELSNSNNIVVLVGSNSCIMDSHMFGMLESLERGNVTCRTVLGVGHDVFTQVEVIGQCIG